MRNTDNEGTVMAALAAYGWQADLRSVAGAVPTYEYIFGTGYVRPSRTGAGRGTTFVDAARVCPVSGRVAFLSVKGHTISGDGKLASDADIASGRRETILALVQAAHGGVALPVLHYAAAAGKEQGYVLAYDAGAAIRASSIGPTSFPDLGTRYARGERPLVTLRMGRPLPSGGRYKAHSVGWVDGEWTYHPAPDRVQYPTLSIGYAAMGVTRAGWTPIHAGDLGAFTERAFPWGGAGFRF